MTMNGTPFISRLLAAAIVTLFSGCLEIKTTTTVNSNGTIQRDIVLKGDSADVLKEFPIFPVDSSWTVSRMKINDSTWVSTTSKLFRDGAALAKALEGVEGKTFRVRVRSEQRFFWFMTEFAYSETLRCYNQFNAVPLSVYFTPVELNLWLEEESLVDGSHKRSMEDSLTKVKFEKIAVAWDSRNKFETYFSLFVKAVERLNNPALTPGQVLARKETLYAYCAGLLEPASTKTEMLPGMFEKGLASPLVSNAIASDPEGFAGFAARARFQDELIKVPYYQSQLGLPGTVTSSNAPSREDTRLVWGDFLLKAYFADYAMWARSRVIHWWTVVGTGSIVLLVVGLLLARARKRRA
jgi:hypothetical protein